MALKGNYVTFRRQTHEHDRVDDGATEHYIVEDTDQCSFMGYLTVRHVDAPEELSATVLLQETQSWGSPAARDLLRAIEQYAFDQAACHQVALEVNGGDTTALEQLEERGFRQREGSGGKLVVVKARDESVAPQ